MKARPGHQKWLFASNQRCLQIIEGEVCGGKVEKKGPLSQTARKGVCTRCGAAVRLVAIGEEVRLNSGRHTVIPRP